MAVWATRANLAGVSREELIQRILDLERPAYDADRLTDSTRDQIEVRRTLKARSPAHWRFRVLRWEKGEQHIKPKEYPEGKTVPNLRIHIHPDDPSEGAPYWDITSKRLIAMLEPILPQIAGTDTYVEVTKDGDGRTSTYSVSILPA